MDPELIDRLFAIAAGTAGPASLQAGTPPPPPQPLHDASRAVSLPANPLYLTHVRGRGTPLQQDAASAELGANPPTIDPQYIHPLASELNLAPSTPDIPHGHPGPPAARGPHADIRHPFGTEQASGGGMRFQPPATSRRDTYRDLILAEMRRPAKGDR